MEHLDSPATPASPALEPGPLLHSTSSLLALPGEILALVVDQALGEYAPRLHKKRLEIIRAISLVNKRMRAIALRELVTATNTTIDDDQDAAAIGGELDELRAPARARAVSVGWPQETGTPMRVPQFLWSFCALRRLWLVRASRISIEDLNQLHGTWDHAVRVTCNKSDPSTLPAELHELVLARVDIDVGRPLALSRLKTLTLFFANLVLEDDHTGAHILAGDSLPVLQHLFIGQSPDEAAYLADGDLIARTSALGFELLSLDEEPGTWQSMGLDEAILDKALFDFVPAEIALLERADVDLLHVRVYEFNKDNYDPLHKLAAQLDELSDRLFAVFPALKTLYVPADFDPAGVMLSKAFADTMGLLALSCAERGVELIFEAPRSAYVVGESRRSAHFEARAGAREGSERARDSRSATCTATRPFVLSLARLAEREARLGCGARALAERKRSPETGRGRERERKGVSSRTSIATADG